jgi:hypothetical protein
MQTYPTSEQVAQIIVAACRETGASPLDVITGQFDNYRNPHGDYPISRARVYAAAAANDEDLECGDFSEGRFAWERDEFSVLPKPIPYRGHQAMFSVPNSLFPTRFASAA